MATFKTGAYKYDELTNSVSVLDQELREQGYVKLADNEQVVIKMSLNEEEARFMKKNEYTSFGDFQDEVASYAKGRFGHKLITQKLITAYFNGWIVSDGKPKEYHYRQCNQLF